MAPNFWTAATSLTQHQSKEELLGFVDHYDGDSVEQHLEFFADPYRRGYAPSNGPHLTISNTKEEWKYPTSDQVSLGNDHEQEILHQLEQAVTSRLRNPMRVDLATIYQFYQQLPGPRMPYLTGRFRHQLLAALGRPEKKDSQSMLRYFAVIADVKNSGLKLTISEWNCAISFASRYVGTSTDAEVESALGLWREMEQDAGIMGNEVTFNILFDVASKAGNFALAEMIYKEMEVRGVVFNRYHHVSLIHFFGLKNDTGGMRAAYREMVNGGEIVDTVVLNCVISGLLRSGEEDAADQVYERMKAKHSQAVNLPARNYTSDKVVTKVYQMFTRISREHPVLLPGFQSVATLTPDLHTYRLLINHYSVVVGDLSKVAKYMDEMKFFQIPLHGAIFLALFKGFHAHGGYTGSAWSEQRLKSIWAALLRALDEGVVGLHIRTWLAMWALRAFKKCSSEADVLEVYEALRTRWDLNEADSQFMVEFLRTLMNPGTVQPINGKLEKRSSYKRLR